MKATKELRSTFTGLTSFIPAFCSNSCQHSFGITTLVEQVEIGHWTLAHSYHCVTRLPLDDQDAEIEDLPTIACFGYPLFNMHALSTESIDERCNLLPIPIGTYMKRIVETVTIAVFDHLYRCDSLMLVPREAVCNDAGSTGAMSQFDKRVV